jgi:hypothetical protein
VNRATPARRSGSQAIPPCFMSASTARWLRPCTRPLFRSQHDVHLAATPLGARRDSIRATVEAQASFVCYCGTLIEPRNGPLGWSNSLTIALRGEMGDSTKITPAQRRSNNLKVFLHLTAGTRDFITHAETHQSLEVQRCLIFLGPMWMHGQAMCDTLRPRGDGSVMWNLPALAVLARTMMECFIGLAHVCEAVSQDERALRSLLWERQVLFKTADILHGGAKINPENAEVAEKLSKRVEEFQVQLECSPALQLIEPHRRSVLLKYRDEHLTSPPAVIWERADLPAHAFHYFWRTLSQWAHVTPLALHIQTKFFDDAAGLIGYSNSALDAAITVLKRGLEITVQQSQALNEAYAAVAKPLADYIPD